MSTLFRPCLRQQCSLVSKSSRIHIRLSHNNSAHHDRYSDLVRESFNDILQLPSVYGVCGSQFWSSSYGILHEAKKLSSREDAIATLSPEVRTLQLDVSPHVDSRDVFGDLTVAVDDTDTRSISTQRYEGRDLDSWAAVHFPNDVQPGADQSTELSENEDKNLPPPSYEEWFDSQGINDSLLNATQRLSYQTRLCTSYFKLFRPSAIARRKFMDDDLSSLLKLSPSISAYRKTMIRSELSQLRIRITFLLKNIELLKDLTAWEVGSFAVNGGLQYQWRADLYCNKLQLIQVFQDFNAAIHDYQDCMDNIQCFVDAGLQCQDIIDYRFRDISLLSEALGLPPKGVRSANFYYEIARLALLGDSAFRTTLVRKWYYTELSKATFDKVFKQVGTNNAMITIMISNKLHECYVGQLAKLDLATIFEAIIGAVYLDGGETAVEHVLAHLGVLDFLEREIQTLQSDSVETEKSVAAVESPSADDDYSQHEDDLEPENGFDYRNEIPSNDPQMIVGQEESQYDQMALPVLQQWGVPMFGTVSSSPRPSSSQRHKEVEGRGSHRIDLHAGVRKLKFPTEKQEEEPKEEIVLQGVTDDDINKYIGLRWKNKNTSGLLNRIGRSPVRRPVRSRRK